MTQSGLNRLYLVRHGENWANIDDVFSCRKIDRSLTPKGILQAQQTAAFFQDKQIRQIYTSPLKRAVETAEIIAAETKAPVQVIDQFREVDVGALEGKPINPTNLAIFESILVAWQDGQPDIAFPQGENYLAVWARMQLALERILAGKSGCNIVVVGHLALFKATARDLCSNLTVDLIRDQTYHNCAVSEILVKLQNGQPAGELISWGTDAHLVGSAAEFASL